MIGSLVSVDGGLCVSISKYNFIQKRTVFLTKEERFKMQNDKQLRFIGTIHSELKNLQDCPRQEKEGAPTATIEIFDEFVEGLKNIQAGNLLILFTWLHKANRTVLETRPRNDNNLPLTGVFSTRSPDRPNPIGIHFVKVEVVKGNQFTVSNLEVLDGTPLIDIKPDLGN